MENDLCPECRKEHIPNETTRAAMEEARKVTYTMAELEKIFSKHHTKTLKEKHKALIAFQKDFGTKSPLPEYLKEDFDIAEALRDMCTAIIKLQSEIDSNV